MGIAPSNKKNSGKLQSIIAFVPALVELQSYTLKKFRNDLFAGLTVAAVSVPQAMAYATIFHMPVQYGLYTAIVMTAVGALFDASRHLINGPTNAISIAMLSALVIVPDDQRIAAAIMMSLLIGAIQIGITLFRLGDLSRFISSAVIVGFTCGASVLLLLNQTANFLGLVYKVDPTDHFFNQFYQTLRFGGPIHWPTVGLAVLTIGVVLICRWINRRWGIRLPDLLAGISVAGVAVWLLKLDAKDSGVALIGTVPTTLPSFQWPMFDWALIAELASSATAVAFLGLLEAIAMVKSLAAKSGQKVDINQQCLSEGLANMVGSFFQCFPGSGSLTRSYINYAAGAVTQWSGIISAVGVAITVISLGPLAAYVPKSSLAGVLVLTAMRMVEIGAVRFHWRATRFDRVIFLATALSVFISIEFCILIGVLLSFLLYVPRAARIWMSELTITADRKVRELKSDDQRCNYFRIYNLEGELFFGCAPQFEKLLEQITAESNRSLAVILLRAKRLHNPDAMCLEILQKWVVETRKQGIIVLFSGVRPDLRLSLRNVGLDEQIGLDNIFPETQELYQSTIRAMSRAYVILGNRRCQNCPKQEPGGQWSYEI